MKDWYTRQEVARLLGVSKATVYHYAKQKKILKIEDPHRLHREARYQKEEVDVLAEQRRRNEPTGMRPSALAKELNVPVQRVYTLIHATDLPVEQLPSGDERIVYSIPEETADWMRKELAKSASPRGVRAEFYDLKHDIALYQLFTLENGQEMRVLRNEDGEWGFLLPSGTWIPYADGRDIFKYESVYSIHQPNAAVRGYTDFVFSKEDDEALTFLDFVYENWGIENIRVREQNEEIHLSIKSGEKEIAYPLPVEKDTMESYLQSGDIIMEGTRFLLVSGSRRTTFDLPADLLQKLRKVAQNKGMTMSEFVETAVRSEIEKDGD